jgi:hypothetical protein
MRELTSDEVNVVAGGVMTDALAVSIEQAAFGSGVMRLIDWVGRLQTTQELLKFIGELFSSTPGGPDYVTDPSSIGARNGSDAMSDNHGPSFGVGSSGGSVLGGRVPLFGTNDL